MHEKFCTLLVRHRNKHFHKLLSLFIHCLHKVNPNVWIVSSSWSGILSNTMKDLVCFGAWMLVQKFLDLTVQSVRFMKVVIIVGSNVQVPFKISVYSTLSIMRCSRLLRAVWAPSLDLRDCIKVHVFLVRLLFSTGVHRDCRSAFICDNPPSAVLDEHFVIYLILSYLRLLFQPQNLRSVGIN